jgi:hypothetical protein
MMQHSVQNQLQPDPKGHPWVKRIVVLLVIVFLVGGIAYGVALAWREYSNVKDSLASEQAKNKELSSKNSQLQKTADSAATSDITDTLSNGKTITYPDTPGNRNILWWSSGAAFVSDNSIRISHKAYVQYMNSTDDTLLTKVCGADASPTAQRADIYYGLFDTSTKKISLSQDQNCLDAMASVANTDATSRAAAQKVQASIKTDIDAFVESITIQ